MGNGGGRQEKEVVDSHKYPYQVSKVPVRDLRTSHQYQVYMGHAPGLKCKEPGVLFQRNLSLDVQSISEIYKIDRVVSLNTRSEFKRLQLDALPRELELKGIAWTWFPLEDMSTPRRFDHFYLLVIYLVQ